MVRCCASHPVCFGFVSSVIGNPVLHCIVGQSFDRRASERAIYSFFLDPSMHAWICTLKLVGYACIFMFGALGFSE